MHHEIAKLYTRNYQFDKAIEHYQAILKLANIDYYPTQAKNSIKNIRKNREVVKDQLAKYHNAKTLYNQKLSEQTLSSTIESLDSMAQAYREIKNYFLDCIIGIRCLLRVLFHFIVGLC